MIDIPYRIVYNTPGDAVTETLRLLGLAINPLFNPGTPSGVEMWTNADFSSDTFWTKEGAATISDGQAHLPTTGDNIVGTAASPVLGGKYKLTVTLAEGSAKVTVLLGGSWATNLIDNVDITETTTFYFTSDSDYSLGLYLYGTSAGAATIESVSMVLLAADDANVKSDIVDDDLGVSRSAGTKGTDAINDAIAVLASALNDLDTVIEDGFVAGAKHSTVAKDVTVAKDSTVAKAEAIELLATLTQVKDLLFNRTVIDRHANGKPKTIAIGDSGAAGTVDTTLDPTTSENIETEALRGEG